MVRPLTPNRVVRGRPRMGRVTALVVLAIALLSAGFASVARAGQFAGVNDHLLRAYSYPSREARLSSAQALGAKVVRSDLRWDQLYPNAEGRADPEYLSEIDAVVSTAQSHGIKLLFTVLGTPCWASSAPQNMRETCAPGVSAYPPTSPQYYAEALQFLAQRYGDAVAGWEVWNEPNISYFWNSSDPAGDYVKLIQAAYPAIKRVTSAPVVGGAVSLSDTDFVGRLYADGIKGNLDALSIHPYSFNYSPLTPGSLSFYGGPVSSFVDGVPAVHNVMLDRGDSSPIWLTEFGWNTSTSGVSPATQATYVTEAYTQMQSWPFVQGGLYYELQDEGTDPTSSEQNYGLLYNGGSQKPAAGAYQRIATTVSAPAPSSPSGAHPGSGGGSGASGASGAKATACKASRRPAANRPKKKHRASTAAKKRRGARGRPRGRRGGARACRPARRPRRRGARRSRHAPARACHGHARARCRRSS